MNIRLFAVALMLFSGVAYAGKVTLTANDVTSAVDIEAAIQSATKNGKERGTVILDGREGPFVYVGPDRSINIATSNVTLRGINAAAIANCADGIFFERGRIRNVKILEIGFFCEGGGIRERGGTTPERVMIRGNVITAGVGIAMGVATNWTISDNTIIIPCAICEVEVGGVPNFSVGIGIGGARNVRIQENDIRADRAVWFNSADGPSTSNHVIANKMSVSEFGIRLLDTSDNRIIRNDIVFANKVPNSSGIVLDNASNNRITRNDICFPQRAGMLLGPASFNNIITRNKAYSGSVGFEVVEIGGADSNLISLNKETILACGISH
jgi:hypothetical protein